MLKIHGKQRIDGAKMSTQTPEIFCYLLIDNGLLQLAPSRYSEAPADVRAAWLEPIYNDKALVVSPLLIDIEAAYEAGHLDRVMELANATRPALHLSLIETTLPRAELAHHLRRFIFIVAPNGKQYTLRYADCAVLEFLPSILTPEQWKAMTAPMQRWGIHDRTHSIVWLPLGAAGESCASTPLQLSAQQMEDLNEALEPEGVLANVRAMRHGRKLPGDAGEQHQWACAARAAWEAAGNEDQLLLTFFADAVLTTRGEILRRYEVPRLLGIQQRDEFKAELRQLMDEMEARRVRSQEMAARAAAMQTEHP
ncbi:DUF4123 domain-containing protein [Massilia horti]|nr:DUF4123 domain-containing protein [Massilia horti]